jgi:CheY-like chemotaxis protein
MPINHPILLVEDNEDDIYLMKRALNEAGVTNPLYTVEDGQEATDYLLGANQFADRSQYPLPSLIFLDLKLPLKSGHEVLAWIRSQPELESIVVVVLTSSDEPADISRAYKLGANSYLVKPPTVEQLLDLAKTFKWYWLHYNRFDAGAPA